MDAIWVNWVSELRLQTGMGHRVHGGEGGRGYMLGDEKWLPVECDEVLSRPDMHCIHSPWGTPTAGTVSLNLNKDAISHCQEETPKTERKELMESKLANLSWGREERNSFGSDLQARLIQRTAVCATREPLLALTPSSCSATQYSQRSSVETGGAGGVA